VVVENPVYVEDETEEVPSHTDSQLRKSAFNEKLRKSINRNNDKKRDL